MGCQRLREFTLRRAAELNRQGDAKQREIRECFARRDFAKAHRLIREVAKLGDEVSELMSWHRRHAA